MRIRLLAGVALGTTMLALVASLLATPVSSVSAQGISGAIFTTNADGSEVNLNQYPSKDAVYLDGGPGVGAPTTAAGLPDGTYYFQVTDPSGKTLLSTDPVSCRQFSVSGGVITSVASAGACAHATAKDVINPPNGLTVQLIPFNDSPNSGDEYKVWVTPVGSYVSGLGVDGFIPSQSKTDNFKVKDVPIREIDTTFHAPGTLAPLNNISEIAIDTLGASNTKWSYVNLAIGVNHMAHIEAIESGVHQVTFTSQAGCTVGEVDISAPGQPQTQTSVMGPQTISITIPKTNSQAALTWYVDVYCA